jgi:DNA polymerase elongation subunit (family B)
MSSFYLNAKQYGDNILYIGIKNGKKIRTKVPYSPSLYVPTTEKSPYKTIYGEYLQKRKPGSIKKCKEFIAQYSQVDNFSIYGNTKYEYCFISDLFPDDIEWDFSKIRIAIVDIEVNSDPERGGFASADDPHQPIISIALKFYGEEKYYLFGYHDFKSPDNVYYIKCKDEYTLIKKFIDVWSMDYPNAVSGWNTAGFDIPYIVNRFNKIVGVQETKKLSPWGFIQEKSTRKFNEKFGRYDEDKTYTIVGVSSLDYIDLYKKYQPGGSSQESYKLDYIAEVEIGENKIEFEGSLHKLYEEDKQKFYEYNLKDVELVESLDHKCKLFELGLTLAYNSKTNFDDIFQQTKMWDALVYDYLKKKNIQIPQNVIGEDQQYEGAFVKPTKPGMHKWIVTLDATSLYPSIIMGKNVSPETLVDPKDYTDDMKNILSQPISVDNLLEKKIQLDKLKENNVTLTPNGQFFRTDRKGFLPEMVEKMFKARQEYKKKMISAQQEYEVIEAKLKTDKTDPNLILEKERLSFEISRFNNLQNAMKLCLNSLYGCLGTKFFRFFDVRQAEAITMEGQLSNRWVANKINAYLNNILKTDEDYIIGGDTDSLFLSLNGLVNNVCPEGTPPNKIVDFLLKSATNKIQPEIDKFCDELSDYVNSYDNKLKYKLEKICSTSIFTRKKRYALNVYSNEGVIYSEPKIKVTGLQIVQSTTPALVRVALKDCLKMILDEDKVKFQSFVVDFKNKFNQFKIEQISFSKGVNGINKYHDSSMIYKKGTPIHVRASIMYNKFLDDSKLNSTYEYIKDGDKIKYCYLRVPNPIRENVIAFPEKLPKEFDLLGYVDYNMMFEKVFLEPLKPLTEIVGWDTEKRNTIEDFF